MIKDPYTPTVESRILDMAGNFVNYFLDHGTGAAWKMEDPAPVGALQWANPENIDTGVSGLILMLIALYRKTKEDQYLLLTDALISDLVQYCEEHPTDNYALYTGRAGVVYALIQAYQLGGRDHLLPLSLELIKPANGLFLQDVHTSDYLYDGRAGTLLVIYHLYLLTGASFLQEYIAAYTLRIITNARTEQGGRIWWIQEGETCQYPSEGFAYGSAGIRYVLTQLQCAANNEGLDLIIRGSATSLTATDDNSWANGAIGIMFSGVETPDSNVRHLNTKLKPGGIFTGDDLFEGTSGWGMYCLYRERFALGTTIAELTERLSSVRKEEYLKGGLMHGKIGVLYFLLHACGGATIAENVLVPFVNMAHTQAPLSLPFGLPEVRRCLLQADYPRTIYFLEKEAPTVLEAFLLTPSPTGAGNISVFISNNAVGLLPEKTYQCLSDLFSLEHQKLLWWKQDHRSLLQLFADRCRYQEMSATQLSKPDEWLKNQQISISHRVKLVETKWDWSFANDLNHLSPKQQENVQRSAGKFEYIIQTIHGAHRQEMILRQDTAMLFHLFRQPKSIHQALTEIGYYIQSQPPALLEDVLFSLTGSRNTDNFLAQLDRVILEKIRQWIYREIFIIS